MLGMGPIPLIPGFGVGGKVPLRYMQPQQSQAHLAPGAGGAGSGVNQLGVHQLMLKKQVRDTAWQAWLNISGSVTSSSAKTLTLRTQAKPKRDRPAAAAGTTTATTAFIAVSTAPTVGGADATVISSAGATFAGPTSAAATAPTTTVEMEVDNSSGVIDTELEHQQLEQQQQQQEDQPPRKITKFSLHVKPKYNKNAMVMLMDE